MKSQHLGIDEETDVLSFPVDGREDVPDGVPRQLGGVILCLQVVGEEWRCRSSTACCTSSATTTDRRWKAARRIQLVATQRTPAVFQSFNYAFEGVIHALRTRRNMRIHFAIAAGVLVLAFIYDVTRLELIALMIAIAFVLIAEMVNTAVEATINLSDSVLRPPREDAKDLAAGRCSSPL